MEQSYEENCQENTLTTWLETGTHASVLLIVGTPGCGASSMLTRCLHTLDIESVWFAPGAVKLRATLRDAAASSFSATGRRKIMVLDGFDAMMTDANSAADIAEFVRRSMPAPAVFLAHKTRTVEKRFRELFNAAARPRATVLVLNPLTVPQIAAIILDKHPSVDPRTAQDLAARAKGDVRAALQAMKFSSEALKDEITEAYAVVDAILEGRLGTVQAALDMASAETAVISHGVHERCAYYPEVAEAFSVADVIEERMFGKQLWELSGVHAALAVAYPAVMLARPEVQDTVLAKPRGEKFTYGMVWSRIHLHAARQKLCRTIALQRMEAGVSDMHVGDLGFIREMVLDAAAARNGPILQDLLCGMHPSGVLAMMRLWKCGYTQAMHARVCKLALLQKV